MEIKNVVIVGGGILGTQVAFQAAYCDFFVTIVENSEEYIPEVKKKLENLRETYTKTIKKMATCDGKNFNDWARGLADYDSFNEEECLMKIENAYKNINVESNLKEAVKDADLIIESITEKMDAKISLFKSIAPLIPQKTIIVTNSSTIIPSKLSKYTKRENKFLSLHFANSIWKNNTAEIMCHSKTDTKIFDEIMEFAKKIRMIPLPVYKEKSGYLLNSMLIPFLFSALDLFVNNISDPKSIDCAWTMGTGAPKGPFMILDTIGLNTAYNIVLNYVKIPSFMAPYNFKGMEKLLKKYIDEGKLGKISGEGFYKY